ncbi:hypothetical protein lerEdw1_013496, partial [Lerista edwardsae]
MFLRGRPITMYIPSAFPNYEELRMELPAEKLPLDWVAIDACSPDSGDAGFLQEDENTHATPYKIAFSPLTASLGYGYRGRDCRSNLYVLTSGELVYFIARVVVLYHVQNRTQRHYLRHTDCVRCVAVHPDGVRVASGQMAGVDKDGKDDGTYLCVVDESNEHMLLVWDCVRGTKQAEIKSTNEFVLTVEFNPQDSSNIISSGKSHIYFWTWSKNSLTKKQGIFGKYKKPKFIQCFVFDVQGDVLTGDSEGNILTWARVAADVRTLGKGAK